MQGPLVNPRPRPSQGSGVDSTFSGQGKLVVEVDGGYHRGRVAEDVARDAGLVAYYGVRVVRIDAGLVELPAAARLGRGAWVSWVLPLRSIGSLDLDDGAVRARSLGAWRPHGKC